MGYGDILDHLLMIQDEVRTESYRKAIEAVVKPGDVVIDFGSGTGILACFAAKARAARVYGIERTWMAAAARRIVKDCGAANVELFEGDAAAFPVAEPADVLVSEWMGHFAFSEWVLEDLIRLRRRALKPGGTLVPSDLSLHAMLVSTNTLHESLAYFRSRPYGLDFSFVAEWPLQMVHRVRLAPSEVVAPVFDLASISLRDVERTPDVLEAEATAGHSVRTYGICGWFSSRLTSGISLDTGPFSPRTHWMQLYFPFPSPVDLAPADRVAISIWPVRTQGMDRTFWRWRVTVGGQVKVDSSDIAQTAWLRASSRQGALE